MQDQQTCGVYLYLHVGQQVGDALVFVDRFAKLHPVARVDQRRLEGCTGNA